MYRSILTTLAVTLLALVPPTLAQNAQRSERIELTTAAPVLVRSDRIEGFESVNYLVTLSAGQALKISLATNNISGSFRVYAAQRKQPLIDGDIVGNPHVFTTATAGEYIIQVYLLRLAARDYQSAEYTLELGLAQ
jgi:hypothetical protein